MVNILTFVENRKLCGNISLASSTVKKNSMSISKSASKQSGTENNMLHSPISQSCPSSDRRKFPIQNSDEIQIMCFITDLMCSIRKSIERNGLMGDELSALKTGFQNILGE